MAWQQDIRAVNALTNEAATGGTVRVRPIDRTGASRPSDIQTVIPVAGNRPATVGTPVRVLVVKAVAGTDALVGPAAMVAQMGQVGTVVPAVNVPAAAMGDPVAAMGDPVADDQAGTATRAVRVLEAIGRGVPVRMTLPGRTTLIVMASVVTARAMIGRVPIRVARITRVHMATGHRRIVRTEVVRNLDMVEGRIVGTTVARAAVSAVVLVAGSAAVPGAVMVAVRGRVSLEVLVEASTGVRATTTGLVVHGSAMTGRARIVGMVTSVNRLAAGGRIALPDMADTAQIVVATPDVMIGPTDQIGGLKVGRVEIARLMANEKNVSVPLKMGSGLTGQSAATGQSGRTSAPTDLGVIQAIVVVSAVTALNGRTGIGRVGRTQKVGVVIARSAMDVLMVVAVMIVVAGPMVIGRIGPMVTANGRDAMVGILGIPGVVIVRVADTPPVIVRVTVQTMTADPMIDAVGMVSRIPVGVRTIPVGVHTARTARDHNGTATTKNVRAGVTMVAGTTVSTKMVRTNSDRGWHLYRMNHQYRNCPKM